MARRRQRQNTGKRETSDFATLEEVLSPSKKPAVVRPTYVTHTSPTALREIEDRRTYHPQGKQRPARSISKPTHRLVLPKQHQKPRGGSKRISGVPKTVQFEAPAHVAVCIRRKTRKEVLHALKRTGKGARARKHRQSEYSTIRC